jgi:hypothetical protein
MGADFIGTFIKVPTVPQDDALAALAAINDDTLDELFADVRGYSPGEDDEDESSRVFFADMLIELYVNILNGDRKDVAEWTIGGEQYLVTGGMTWGDTPTESYDVIEAVRLLGVTE